MHVRQTFRVSRLAMIACVWWSCSHAAPPPAAWSEAWLAQQQALYLDSAVARRASLEASLLNHANSYSQHRLGAYGLVDSGWDLLPVWNPRSVTFNTAASSGAPSMPMTPATPLWDGVRPTRLADWIELGRKAFFTYPLRSEFAIEHVLAPLAEQPGATLATANSLGLETLPNGDMPGVVAYADIDGGTRLGITCALCHTVVRDGALVVGAARRRLDFGALRLTFFRETNSFVEPELARRMASWGPGRADVTEDDDQDPVAIPDLWALRDHQYLTQAGTIRHIGPAALAIRQETQLLHANLQRIRPPREIAWAMAMFLYSLTPPPLARVPGNANAAQVAHGQQLFDQHCGSCHASPSWSGDAYPVARIGTDPALATGHGRGTGRYRTPALVRVSDAAPYLHDGSVRSLDELLGPERLAPDYTDGLLGPGPIVGHRFGTELSSDDRRALRIFLETL